MYNVYGNVMLATSWKIARFIFQPIASCKYFQNSDKYAKLWQWHEDKKFFAKI
jgi:hypothetical protein